MRIREYLPGDLAALKRMHADSGFAYQFPELDDPQYLVKLVGITDEGQPLMGAMLRLTSEAYLLMDKNAGTARDRWERLLVLHETVRRAASRVGIEDVHAFLPKTLTRRFDARLKDLGWTEETWRCWWRRVDPVN